jgi:hypothetical protein
MSNLHAQGLSDADQVAARMGVSAEEPCAPRLACLSPARCCALILVPPNQAAPPAADAQVA